MNLFLAGSVYQINSISDIIEQYFKGSDNFIVWYGPFEINPVDFNLKDIKRIIFVPAPNVGLGRLIYKRNVDLSKKLCVLASKYPNINLFAANFSHDIVKLALKVCKHKLLQIAATPDGLWSLLAIKKSRRSNFNAFVKHCLYKIKLASDGEFSRTHVIGLDYKGINIIYSYYPEFIDYFDFEVTKRKITPQQADRSVEIILPKANAALFLDQHYYFSNKFIELVNNAVNKILNENKIGVLYVKPHPSSPENRFNFNKSSVITKKTPAEELISRLGINLIISFNSSLLVNAKLEHGDDVKSVCLFNRDEYIKQVKKGPADYKSYISENLKLYKRLNIEVIEI